MKMPLSLCLIIKWKMKEREDKYEKKERMGSHKSFSNGKKGKRELAALTN